MGGWEVKGLVRIWSELVYQVHMVAIIILAGSLEETILYSLNRRKSVAITMKMTVFHDHNKEC